MSSSVLAHITAKLTSQRENAATEALAFILNRSPAARAALSRQLGVSLGISRVVTQAAAGDESRPDLLLLDDGGRTVGYIEAKFWAALTEAQPVAYLERLREIGGGVLVVLAPERRLHLLKAEVRERCGRAALDISAWGPNGALVTPSRIVMLSWHSLLDRLEHALVEDRDTLGDLRQVRGLCERFETEGFIPLTREDIDNLDVPRLVRSLADLAGEVVDAGVGQGLLDVKGLRASHFWTAAGRYARLPAGCVLWIGVSYDRWWQFGGTPMWAQVGYPKTSPPERQALQSWLAGASPRAYLNEGEDVLVALTVPAGVEKDAAIESILAQLRALAAALAMGGASMPPLPSG